MSKVVIVEKNKNIRDGIRIFINRFSHLECENSYESFESFWDKVDQINSDVLLLQIELKDKKFVKRINELRNNYPNLAIVLLTMNEEDDIIYDALINGAVSYVHKNAPAQKLVKVIENAAEKKLSINSIVARKTENCIKQKNLQSVFKGKELNLLRMVTEGNNLTAIEKAYKLDSEEIKRSFWNIFNKLYELKSNNAF